MSLDLFLRDEELISRLRQGPLGEFMDLFAKQLSDDGYHIKVACAYIRVAANFVRWLRLNCIAFEDVGEEHIQRYLRYRRRKGMSPYCAVPATKNFFLFLQAHDVCPKLVRKKSNAELLIDSYVKYLQQERALSANTIEYYQHYALSFLNYCFNSGAVDVLSLRANDVLEFVERRAGVCMTRAKHLVVALRSFFRYLKYQGLIALDLAAVVPRVAHWRNSRIPRSISPDEVKRVLSTYNGAATTLELRDKAILYLLARLGLRAGEIASLRLDDIDWRAGSISVLRGISELRCLCLLTLESKSHLI